MMSLKLKRVSAVVPNQIPALLSSDSESDSDDSLFTVLPPVRRRGMTTRGAVADCSVQLTRLRSVEIIVTRPTKNTRRIRYSLEDAGNGAGHPPIFNMLWDVTMNALPKRASSRSVVPAVASTTLENGRILITAPRDHFFEHVLERTYGDLDCMLCVLTGKPIHGFVLDTYIDRLFSVHQEESDNVRGQSSHDLRRPLANGMNAAKFVILTTGVVAYPIGETSNCPDWLVDDKLIPKFDCEDDLVVIAPLSASRHFYLAVLEYRTKSAYVYDSAWHYISKQLRVGHVKRLLATLFPECGSTWKIFFVSNCVQQIDDTSCGCYVVYFIKNIIASKIEKSVLQLRTADIARIRGDMARDLLSTTTIGRQFLEAISI